MPDGYTVDATVGCADGSTVSTVNSHHADHGPSTVPSLPRTFHEYVPFSANAPAGTGAASQEPDAPGPTVAVPSGAAPPVTHHSNVAVTAAPSPSVTRARSCG